MIRLVDDKTSALKLEMKNVQSRIVKQIRALRKPSSGSYPIKERALQIRQLEYRKNLYNPARHLPVEIDRIVIDYQVLTKFEKKLKHCDVTYTLDVGGLTVAYKNQAGQTGTLRLLDMRDVYKQIVSFPRAELVEPVLAE